MANDQDVENSGPLVRAIEWALEVDGPELSAYGSAARQNGRGKTPRQIAERIIQSEALSLGAKTFVTGMVNNPLAAVPAAVAEVGYVLRRQAVLIGRVAAVIDPDSVMDSEFQTDVFAVMFGPQLLRQAAKVAGVQGFNGVGRVLIRKYISKNVLKQLIRFVARYLGIKIGQKTLLRAIPILGGVIGGGVNIYDTKRVGARAIAYFSERLEANA